LQFFSWENTSLLEDLDWFWHYDVAKAHKEHSEKSQKLLITAPLLGYVVNTNY